MVTFESIIRTLESERERERERERESSKIYINQI